MFADLKNYLNRISRIDSTRMWFKVVDKDVKFEVIRLNTDEQLFNKGIDSEGDSLGDYSEVSVQVYGKRRGHIQLYDEGDFYNSFRVSVTSNEIQIYADDSSKYDSPLTTIYGEDILGLTDENMIILVELLKENYLKEINAKLFY